MRDLRVRWTLEEAALPYEVMLSGPDDQKSAKYRAMQPFDGLAAFLGDRPNLVEERFTAADLMMTTALRILRTTDLVGERPALEAYKRRHEARPAFQKAVGDQMAAFAANATAKV